MTSAIPQLVVAPEPDRSDWYVQVAAPGVPYSAIRVAFTHQGVAEAVLMCKYLAQEWRKAFDAAPPSLLQEALNAGATRVDHEEPHYEPFLGDERDAPAPRTESRPSAAGEVVAYCPEHANAGCRFSAPQYNKDGDRLYHPLGEGQWTKDARGTVVKNHSLYWRRSVDAQGESNQGKPLPALVPAGARP